MKMHTFCISKVCLLHFFVPSRRPGFSRTPMNLLLISRFCDFGKVESSRSRAWTFRVRVRAGMRNRAHASAKLMLCKKSQNCKMRQENIGVREICGRPDGAQKYPKQHFLRCKSVLLCILASALRGPQVRNAHFLHLKSVSFCTFVCPRGDWKTHGTI